MQHSRCSHRKWIGFGASRASHVVIRCNAISHKASGINLYKLRRVKTMPEQETLEQAKKDEQEGKAPSTQAGEFVREEMHHVREGKHGARSTKQAIAIGLSKARRAGVKLAAPRKGKASAQIRKKAQRDLRKGQASRKRKPSPARSRAISGALKREGRAAASP